MSRKSADSWVRIIDVTNPVLHKKGYTLYKVTSKVFPKSSVEAVTEVTVWKRYNDFKKLYKALNTLHQSLYLKGTFPEFAKTQYFGRFEPSVIEERRLSALKLLQFAAQHAPLFTSQVFVKFFEDSQAVGNIKTTVSIEDKLGSIPQKRLNSGNLIDSNIYKNNSDKDLLINENEIIEPISPLGGIWQHHQMSDNLSLASQCTDDDDRTTFTDDDSVTSRPSLNLFEFDPLLQSDGIPTEQNSVSSHQENLCNSWLLSALRTSSISDSERDLESILEFPPPFGDCDAKDDYLFPSREHSELNNLTKNSEDTHFPFDVPTPVAQESVDLSEFDPLSSSATSIENYDSFAATPNANTKEQRRPSYILEAANHVLTAQTAEESSRYSEAFEYYKKAIEILLHGYQKDKCDELKDIVHKKVYLYLMKAEELYENKLPKTNTEKVSPTAIPVQHTSIKSSLHGSVPELNKYKVLGIIDKVLLVLDVSTNNTYIVKTLYKSSDPQKVAQSNIVPQNVPFVVKLHCIYETSYAIFLILEHATGGRLWDYVSSFLQRSPLNQGADEMLLYVDPKSTQPNVYSGRKAKDDDSEVNRSVDSDLTPSKKCPSSYVALFKKHADSVGKEENVSLAKYHKFQRKTSGDHNPHSILQHHQKTLRNRLTVSTGSLETTGLQKPSFFDFANAYDEASSQSLPKTNLPESCVVMWAAELVLALESLHKLGIVCVDLHPKNILLGAEGHILLSYQSQWSSVDFNVDEASKENLFSAPEVGSIFPVSYQCDWWSLGAILFELLTGYSLAFCHPSGITCHTILNFPTDISPEAKDVTTKLLQFNPTERLGACAYGVEEIKCHRFFRSVNWETLSVNV